MTQFIKSYIIYIIILLSWVWGQCDEGYTEIDGECYYQSDLDVLQQFIDNSQEGGNPPPSDLLPIELGYQVWQNGRLFILCCSTDDWGSNEFPSCQEDYQLSGLIPTNQTDLSSLYKLSLHNNQLTGEIPDDIGNLANLYRLYLHYNLLNGEIPESLGDITGLHRLRLQHNQLTGEIPSTIGNLTNLTYLNFSNNELTGGIPNSFQSLTSLNVLYLDNNNLTGSIENLINSTSISSLGLSNNMFSGIIPEWICDFQVEWSSPTGFKITNNMFCPPYPECINEYIGYQDTSNCGQNNIEIVYQSDWNLVGLPVEVENPYYLTLFPDAIENTLFSFDDAYIPDSIMIEGEGYWLRFESAGNTTITGNTINELTISLNEGWNLISGISTPLNITDIQDTDGIIIAGTVYGFTSDGYSNEEIIEPGKGYWIRANSSGSIILTSD